MSDQDILKRFEELEAGRILGDLDADEVKEWEELSKDPRCQIDFSLELTAAAIETEFLQSREAVLPDKVLANLNAGKAQFVTDERETENVVRPAAWQKLISSPQTAWAIAAVFAILFVAKSLVQEPVVNPRPPAAVATPSPEEARNELLGKAGDLVESDFGGIKRYDEMSGKVVWSDEHQEGYMTLTNLPANDPTANQYQLWIVDPNRDEKPVDGGVFDIPSNGNTAVIPIRNPLAITKPQAFVITLEQPGGVVVSKQEVVVALAKTS